MLEKESNVTALVQASGELRQMAYPLTGKRALLKLSAMLPWSYRHIKAVYYQECGTVVDADEMEELRARKALSRKAKLTAEEQEAANEVAQLRERIARLEQLLLAKDAEFYCEDAAALRVARGRSVRED